MNKVKNKAVLNKFTVRQTICFSAAAVFGLPTYFLTRSILGQSLGAVIMVTMMVPFFLLAMYEKDGMPLEQIIKNIILVRFVLPAERPYKTSNLYELKDDQSNSQEDAAVGKTNYKHEKK